MSVSVILPTWNEKDSILSLISEIHEVLLEFDHEIIVVDDNSPDGTFDLAMTYSAPYIKAVLHSKDRSLAGSIAEGIRLTTKDKVIIMDSDFNHQPQYIPQMLRLLQPDCVVSASRFLPGGGMRPYWRYLSSHILNLYAGKMLKTKVTDHFYGFFAANRQMICSLPMEHIFFGYGEYSIRLLYELTIRNISILEFPAQNGQRKGQEKAKNYYSLLLSYLDCLHQLRSTHHHKNDLQNDQHLPALW